MSTVWLSTLREPEMDPMPFLEGARHGGSTRRIRGELVDIEPDPWWIELDPPEPEPEEEKP